MLNDCDRQIARLDQIRNVHPKLEHCRLRQAYEDLQDRLGAHPEWRDESTFRKSHNGPFLVFNLPELELYRIANPEQKAVVREASGVYRTQDPLIGFIDDDVARNPAHRQTYEVIATAFGYQKGTRP